MGDLRPIIEAKETSLDSNIQVEYSSVENEAQTVVRGPEALVYVKNHGGMSCVCLHRFLLKS